MADADPHRMPTADITAAGIVTPAPRRNWTRLALILLVPLLIAGVGAYFWLNGGQSVSTDNAYVRQDKVSVSSDVGGRIVTVAVQENQAVKAGDLLFGIDPAPYRIAVEQANAAIANAQVQVTTMRASYAGTAADIAGARAAVVNAQQSFARQQALQAQGFTTRASFQAAELTLEQARAQLANAQAAAAEARSKLTFGAAVPGENPAIAAAQVQRSRAQLDLSRTQIRAPVSGTISQAGRLQVGNMMVTGLPAVTIVASSRSWIDANFKETDLNRMRVNQPAELTFDAYPGLHLRGHVQSIGAGTGSEFSVLPAQNATGNWVKVTQRVPVRIAIDEASPRQLIAGQSANVKVDIRGVR